MGKDFKQSLFNMGEFEKLMWPLYRKCYIFDTKPE